MAKQRNGSVAVNLLDEAGKVIETKYLSSGPIMLTSEQVKQKSFTFSQTGSSVEANYFAISSEDGDGTLSMLELRGLPFAFDKDTLTCTVTAVDGQTAANLTAVPSNLEAKVSINGDEAKAGIRAEEVAITNGGKIPLPASGRATGTTKRCGLQAKLA